MKLLELFCGTKSITKIFQKDGFDTYTIDFDEPMSPDWCVDILTVTPEMILERFGQPDFIWASPPCTTFSVASIGRHWNKEDRTPKSEAAKVGLKILEHTIYLIQELNPKYFFIENPRGMMRKLPIMQQFPRYTVTYCKYGDTRMKPTDIWTNHPNPNFIPPCKNGDPCHEPAPRGSQSGTQGMKNARVKGVIPPGLCQHICNLCKGE